MIVRSVRTQLILALMERFVGGNFTPRLALLGPARSGAGKLAIAPLGRGRLDPF
jgi:hypothetical protein